MPLATTSLKSSLWALPLVFALNLANGAAVPFEEVVPTKNTKVSSSQKHQDALKQLQEELEQLQRTRRGDLILGLLQFLAGPFLTVGSAMVMYNQKNQEREYQERIHLCLIGIITGLTDTFLGAGSIYLSTLKYPREIELEEKLKKMKKE